jgi:hypothetical protein
VYAFDVVQNEASPLMLKVPPIAIAEVTAAQALTRP